MDKQRIIVISREFGSGGHVMGETIAKRMGLTFYDRNLLDEIAKEKMVEVGEWEQYDEKPKFRIFHRTVRDHSSSPEDNLAYMQFEYIKRKAEEGESFLIVGRCAEMVLKDFDSVVSIFVLGNPKCKLERIMDRYHMTQKEAEKEIRRHDKKRKTYHNHYSEYHWGDSRAYDLCINSSTLGLDKTIDYVEKYVREFFDGE